MYTSGHHSFYIEIYFILLFKGNEYVFLNKKHNIYKTVAEEIGTKWRELGRELGLKESQLDQIHAQNRDDITNKVYEILRKFEEITLPRNYYNTMCNALTDVRRRDLTKKLQCIMEN